MALLWWLLQHQQMSCGVGIGSVGSKGTARRPLKVTRYPGHHPPSRLGCLCYDVMLLLIACLPSGDKLAHDLTATSW